jgi:hypothetical protein
MEVWRIKKNNLAQMEEFQEMLEKYGIIKRILKGMRKTEEGQ